MLKRLHMLLLSFALFAGVAACGEKKDTMSFDSFYNAETGVTISLGMSRGEVEDLLGEGKYLQPIVPQEGGASVKMNTDESLQDYSYGEGKNYIALTYQNDLVGGISTSIAYERIEIGPSNWCVKYGLTYGNTSEDIVNQYGKSKSRDFGEADDGKHYSILEYYYDASGKRLDEYYNCSHVTMFLLDDSNHIHAIGIYDATPESSY